MDSILHGFVRLLSNSTWFCLASTTHLIQIQSGTEHRISFSLLNSLHGFSPGFVWLLFPQLLVLFGFHNSLNTNPKRSGTLDFILTFEQLAWILSCMVLCGFFPQLLVLFGFHNLLNTNPRRSGTSDFILTFEQFAWIL